MKMVHQVRAEGHVATLEEATIARQEAAIYQYENKTHDVTITYLKSHNSNGSRYDFEPMTDGENKALMEEAKTRHFADARKERQERLAQQKARR